MDLELENKAQGQSSEQKNEGQENSATNYQKDYRSGTRPQRPRIRVQRAYTTGRSSGDEGGFRPEGFGTGLLQNNNNTGYQPRQQAGYRPRFNNAEGNQTGYQAISHASRQATVPASTTPRATRRAISHASRQATVRASTTPRATRRAISHASRQAIVRVSITPRAIREAIRRVRADSSSVAHVRSAVAITRIISREVTVRVPPTTTPTPSIA